VRIDKRKSIKWIACLSSAAGVVEPVRCAG
jgi:hypothetical protein